MKSCAEVTVQLRCDVVALPQKAPRLALTHQTASTGPHQGLHKRTRCRECAGCLRANCGACVSCRDMLKFGGSGKKAKACMQRVCLKLHRQHQLSFASSQGPSGSADGRHVSSTVLADESDNSAYHGAIAAEAVDPSGSCAVDNRPMGVDDGAIGLEVVADEMITLESTPSGVFDMTLAMLSDSSTPTLPMRPAPCSELMRLTREQAPCPTPALLMHPTPYPRVDDVVPLCDATAMLVGSDVDCVAFAYAYPFPTFATQPSCAATPHGPLVISANPHNTSSGGGATAEAARAHAKAVRSHFEACASKFDAVTPDNIEDKMAWFSSALEDVYGELPFTRLDWPTSILGTLVGLICAQNTHNSWSSINYAKLAATFPTESGEPNWDLIRQRSPVDIEPCIWHGPYFHSKAERIHGLLNRAFDDFGGATTSMEQMHAWDDMRIRRYLMGINGISSKSVACLLLYRMGRVDFAVDANVLRVMTRLGWLKPIGLHATEGLSRSDRKAALRAGTNAGLSEP